MDIDSATPNSASSKLKTTISQQESELSSLKKQYTDVVMEQGKDSDAAKDLQSKYDQLNSELTDNKNKMSAAESAASALGKANQSARTPLEGNRSHKSMEDQPEPPAILKRLGIEMRNAIVRNAKAKPIERTFRTVKEQFSKLFEGFCGGTILERPESLKARIKNGKIPRDYEIRDVFDSWIDGEYNCQNYGGSECCFKGMSRIDVWNKTIKEVRQANERDLNLMLMSTTRVQKIKRNGVYVTICGEKYWYMNPEETIMNLQHEVFVRYDPADLRSVRLYDAVTDKFMFEWQLADVLMLNYLEELQENVADAQERIKMTKKFAHEQAAGITARLHTKVSLESGRDPAPELLQESADMLTSMNAISTILLLSKPQG